MTKSQGPKEKISLRKRILQIRKDIVDRAAKSSQITSRLISLPVYKLASKILLYASKQDEVDTWELIKLALADQKTVFLPIVDNYTIGQVENLEALKPNKWSILEPTRASEEFELDLIILPGIAFDRNGNRLGTGAGWYDRFLSRVGRKTTRIGLAFKEQIIEEVPVMKYDQGVDLIVTEEELIDC